ncbi:MAG: UDP-N-acetylglucosamine 2-epimerase (non-hydrolyzing) [Bdellovibrionota bacterium]
MAQATAVAKKLKVMTIVGTRPELIKLSRVIAELDKYTEHVLVHTGQNYDFELNEVFFRDLEIRKPNHFLGCGRETAIETIGASIVESDKIMAQENPDAILLYGDTNSCLSVISAKRRKIPIFHMEAGNRCFDQRVPEEINRKIVDHLSDINMPLTEHARRYLIAEGIPAETVIKTGSCMKEVLDYYAAKTDASDVLQRMDLAPQGYFLVSAHREENVDVPEVLRNLIVSLNTLAQTYGKRVIVSTHPRTKKRLADLGEKEVDKRVEFMNAMGFHDYVKLQKNALCVLSDSGTISEETSILNLSSVMLRAAHERPEGMDEGVTIQAPLNASRILNAVATVLAQRDARNGEAIGRVADYDAENVSSKVVRIILSYTDYVNRTVWSKT